MENKCRDQGVKGYDACDFRLHYKRRLLLTVLTFITHMDNHVRPIKRKSKEKNVLFAE